MSTLRGWPLVGRGWGSEKGIFFMSKKLFQSVFVTIFLGYAIVSHAYTLGENITTLDSDTDYEINADFLYVQDLEMGYGDNWYGQNFKGLVKIQSDGKIGLFVGILKLNCKNKTFKWEKAVSRTDEKRTPRTAKEIKEAVPPQVTKNALALYCKSK